MRKNFRLVNVLVLLFCVLLSACSGIPSLANAQQPSQTASPLAIATSTSIAPASTPGAPLSPQTVQSLFAGVLAGVPEAKGYGYIQAEALKASLAFNDKPFLLDVREPSEIQTSGYILGAVNIPLRDLLNNLDKLPGQSASIVIYSNTGNRSGMAMAALMLLGYTNVRDLAGGFSSWVHTSKYPVVTGLKPADPPVRTPNPVISDQATYNMLNAFLSSLPDNFYEVDTLTLSQELAGTQPPTVIDMNTAADHQKYGHIPGAVFIGFSDFFNHLDKLPSENTPIVIYAVGGGHSSILVMGLREMGYTNVLSLKGGIIAWKNAGLPLQAGGGN